MQHESASLEERYKALAVGVKPLGSYVSRFPYTASGLCPQNIGRVPDTRQFQGDLDLMNHMEVVLLELFILLAVILIMTAIAILMALHEQPLPVGASSAFRGMPPANRPIDAPSGGGKPITTVVLPAEPRQPSTSKEIESVTNENQFSQTDVLLADALTEMIGLKTELYHLRSKLDSLNFEVARLSGGPHRTPPAVSKQPAQLRKAA